METLLTEQLCFSVPARLDACAIIREQVNQMAVTMPFSDADLDDIRLAVGEAASNAVRHGCRNRPWAEVKVRCWASACEIGIEIEDDGPGFDLGSVARPDFENLPEGGMGIFYMRESMDSVDFSFNHGTRVTLIKRFSTSTKG